MRRLLEFGWVAFTVVFGFHSAISKAGMYTERELKAFLKKDPKCYMAIAVLAPGPKFKTGEPNLGHSVMCVSDFTVNTGTIAEATGCAFAIYDVDRNALISPYGDSEDPSKIHRSGFPIVEGENCPDGGFFKLLKKYPGITYGDSVEEALTKGPLYSQGLYLVYSMGPTWDTWWKEHVKKRGPKTLGAEKKKLDCSSISMTRDEELQCSTPDQLIGEVCSINPDPSIVPRVKAVYAKKTGMKFPAKCPEGSLGAGQGR